MKAWTRARSALREHRGARAVGLALALGLGGCAGLWPAPYGEMAPDAEPVRSDGLPNVMPSNAPSTLNGHWAGYDGHQGIDILAEVGTPVLAPAAGTVIEAYFEPMYGNRVVLEHGLDEQGNTVRTFFLHLDRGLVEPGQRVQRGQPIAELGRTGMLAIAIPHLHYEVRTRVPGRWTIFETRNPNRFWFDGPGYVTCFDRDRHFADQPFRTTYPVPCRGVAWR